ncbi:MAG: ATP-binding protein [Chloroflexota bacterium]
MADTTRLPTKFAPAERASTDKIRAQAQYFLDVPLLHQLFDAIPDIVLILNEQRQIIFANSALLKVLGLDSKYSVLGLRPGEALGCTHAFETEGGCGTTEFCKTCGAVQAILSSLQGREAIKECRITQKSGEALDLQVWATPINLDGEQFSVFAVKDISHEKRRRALERVFFHDILNAASGVRGFAELLTIAAPEELELVKTSLFNLSERLIDEINAQRDLTAAENNELTVHPVQINSQDLLQELIAGYQHYVIINQCQLIIDPDSQAIQFTGDRTLLRRVLGNMVKNALEASKPDQTVTLGCYSRKQMVEFTVHNPAYIPRPIQLQIFQRSFSTKGQGRGLGTYGIRLLTERYLKGKVFFTSSQKQGTVFKAHYPLTWTSQNPIG